MNERDEDLTVEQFYARYPDEDIADTAWQYDYPKPPEYPEQEQNPIRVFYDEVTERFYASRGHRDENGHVVVTGEKFDVTNDIAFAVRRYDIEFEEVNDD